MDQKSRNTVAAIIAAISLASCTPPFDRYMLEGQAAMDKNQYEKAIDLFHKAVLEARRSSKAKANLVAALEAEAVCAENLKQVDREIKLMEEAAKACKSDASLGPIRAAKLEKRMGDLQFGAGNDDRAFEYYKQSLETLEGANAANSLEAGSVYIALGDMNSTRKSFKEARKYYETGLMIIDDDANQGKTFLELGAALNKLANVYRELNMEDEATELETQARLGQVAGTRGKIRKMLSGIPGGR